MIIKSNQFYLYSPKSQSHCVSDSDSILCSSQNISECIKIQIVQTYRCKERAGQKRAMIHESPGYEDPDQSICESVRARRLYGAQ